MGSNKLISSVFITLINLCGGEAMKSNFGELLIFVLIICRGLMNINFISLLPSKTESVILVLSYNLTKEWKYVLTPEIKRD